jgi:paired amphipathic helix protein Sin3a
VQRLNVPQVYEQVTALFQDAPDLISEFKQFLPEHGGGAFGGSIGTLLQSSNAVDVAVAQTAGAKRVSKEASGGVKKKRATQAEIKAKVSISPPL